MRFHLQFVLLLLCLYGCTSPLTHEVTEIALIPKPQQIERGEGTFILDKNTTLFVAEGFDNAADFLQQYLQMGAGIHLEIASEQSAVISLIKDSTLASESYTLTISESVIVLKAKDAAGAFYGVQTLRQLLPPELERINSVPNQRVVLPVLTIQDAPAFRYRGMHLDVSRHFFPKEFIKKYIEHLALLKINTFHWHLTDDQGWRIEIKKYPKLTSHGAYRDSTLIGHYNATPQRYEKKRYGGFYTQEDIKEIVAFAEQRHVTVIPEIEMPGHAQAAISAYPEFGCTRAQVPVASTWGVFENIYCPKEETFSFLEDVLDEVIQLFPGEYIQIGGDEAPKTQWKKCAHCQNLIAQEGLVDEHGLQSYFIERMEQFLNEKGKKLIGWDEILEGGLAPNATVMSWRGTEGAIQAAQEGHDVVLTPTSHAYFDYYQDDHPDEPLAIGGYLPLKKVYGFHPVPEAIQGTEAATHVLGAQGNIWTEYMDTSARVEYMAFPRMLAMAEVVWNGPTTNLDEDYNEFLTRIEPFMNRLDALGINYANHLYDLEGKVEKQDEQILFKLNTPTENKEIRVRMNASEEIIYKDPLILTENTKVEARVYKDGKKVGRSYTEDVRYHKGVTAGVKVNSIPHAAYSAGGIGALINGVSGSDTRYGDKEWLGFWGDDLEIEIIFLEPTEITTVSTRFYNANGQWIYAPESMSVKGTFTGGDQFETTITIDNKETLCEAKIDLKELIHRKVNRVILRIPSYGVIPDGMQGAGNKAWTFIDEIIIE